MILKIYFYNNKMNKENYSLIIYSADRIRGLYNYDSYYNVDWDNLFKKKFNNNQKQFKVRWYIGSKNKTNVIGDNLGLLFIDFSAKTNQQDSKLNNNITNVGIIKKNTFNTGNGSYFYLTNLNEYESIIITKPTSNIIRVYFRNCDNTQFFNGTNDNDYVNLNIDLPDFYIKLELEAI